MLQVHSRLLLCEAKLITGRKLYLRVIPELTVLGFGRKDPAPVLRGGGKRSAAPTEKAAAFATEYGGGAILHHGAGI